MRKRCSSLCINLGKKHPSTELNSSFNCSSISQRRTQHIYISVSKQDKIHKDQYPLLTNTTQGMRIGYSNELADNKSQVSTIIFGGQKLPSKSNNREIEDQKQHPSDSTQLSKTKKRVDVAQTVVDRNLSQESKPKKHSQLQRMLRCRYNIDSNSDSKVHEERLESWRRSKDIQKPNLSQLYLRSVSYLQFFNNNKYKYKRKYPFLSVEGQKERAKKDYELMKQTELKPLPSP